MFFYEAGLSNIDMKQNEKVHFMVPPYSTPEQQMKKNSLLKEDTQTKKDKKYWTNHWNEAYFAAGGSKYLLNKMRRMGKIIKKEMNIKKSVEENQYISCSGGTNLFACKGTK